MRVYLVQHGDAKLKEEHRDRPLTQKGHSDVRRAEAFLKPLGLKVRAIWHSGKTRARETAETLALAVESEQGLVAREGLGPEDDVNAVFLELEMGGEDLMIVGHMPFLGRLAGRLLVGDADAEPASFHKGGVVCLEWGEDGFWRLDWALTPEII